MKIETRNNGIKGIEGVEGVEGIKGIEGRVEYKFKL